MRSAIAIATLVAALVGCGGGGGGDEDAGYPTEAVERFVAACRSEPGASADRCRCVIARLQETMPYDEFERADAVLKQGGEPDVGSLEKLRTAASGCVSP